MAKVATFFGAQGGPIPCGTEGSPCQMHATLISFIHAELVFLSKRRASHAWHTHPSSMLGAFDPFKTHPSCTADAPPMHSSVRLPTLPASLSLPSSLSSTKLGLGGKGVGGDG